MDRWQSKPLDANGSLLIPIRYSREYSAVDGLSAAGVHHRPTSVLAVKASKDVVTQPVTGPSHLALQDRFGHDGLPAVPSVPLEPAVNLFRWYASFDQRLRGLPER